MRITGLPPRAAPRGARSYGWREKRLPGARGCLLPILGLGYRKIKLILIGFGRRGRPSLGDYVKRGHLSQNGMRAVVLVWDNEALWQNLRMTPKLTNADEIRNALQRDPTKPVRVRDDQTDKFYLIFDEHALPTLWEDYIRREVQRGLQQLDRGEGQPLDIEATITEAHRRHAARDK